MNDREILIKARSLIEDKDKWFGGDNPPDKDRGAPGRLCALLAVDAASMKSPGHWDIIRNHFQMSVSDLVIFNNKHTHVEVLKLFDDAIVRSTQHEMASHSVISITT